ncbi:MAG: lysylphosphatidylglycerol synthase domain-containing protein, partial [Woeseiaceae bacterium]
MFRVIFSGVLLTAILSTINIEEAIQLVGRSNLLLLALAALVLLSVRIVTALRWFVLLRAYGVDITYWAVLRITFVSTAVGQFIPGGADAVSIYQVFRESGKLSEISIAVLFDRLFGIAAMLIIATCA